MTHACKVPGVEHARILRVHVLEGGSLLRQIGLWRAGGGELAWGGGHWVWAVGDWGGMEGVSEWLGFLGGHVGAAGRWGGVGPTGGGGVN